jgi:hypothetical protein
MRRVLMLCVPHGLTHQALIYFLPLNSTSSQRISTFILPLQASYESSIGGASNEWQVDEPGIISFVHQPSKDWILIVHNLLLLPSIRLEVVVVVVLLFRLSISQLKSFRLYCSKSWRKPINSLRIIHSQAKQIRMQSLL